MRVRWQWRHEGRVDPCTWSTDHERHTFNDIRTHRFISAVTLAVARWLTARRHAVEQGRHYAVVQARFIRALYVSLATVAIAGEKKGLYTALSHADSRTHATSHGWITRLCHCLQYQQTTMTGFWTKSLWLWVFLYKALYVFSAYWSTGEGMSSYLLSTLLKSRLLHGTVCS